MEKEIFKGSVFLNPVPAVLITSRKDDKYNVFTVAWCGTVCTNPPMLTISIRPERLSYEYIKDSGEFTINLPPKALTKMVDFCGVRSGRQVYKIKECGFTIMPTQNISSGYIKECPINIECVVESITHLGTHDMFLARVVASHIDKNLIDERGKIHFEKANLIAYSHGEYFALPQRPLGSFGYSVRKKKKKK